MLRKLLVGAVAGVLVLGLGTGSAAAGTDAPGTIRSVTSTKPLGNWVTEVLSSTKDVDTFRFTTGQARYARILLGDLRADYRLRLYSAGGDLLATSDRSGRGNEEIYEKLAAGTYYVKVDAPHGKRSTSPYVVRFSSLAEGVHLLSSSVMGTGPYRVLVFEVLNNTARTLDGVGWSVAPASCGGCPPYESFRPQALAARDRASFVSVEVPGPGEVLSVVGGEPVSYTTKLSVAITRVRKGDGWTEYDGRVTNGSTHKACDVRADRNAYDDRGRLVEVTGPDTLGTLRAGASDSFANYYFWDPPASAVRTAWDTHEVGPSNPLPC